MSDSKRIPRRTLWLWALAIALTMCSGHVLTYAFRSVWRTHYPILSSQWGNNGPFTVLGWFATSTNQEEVGYAARVKNASEHLLHYDAYIKEYRSKEQLVNEFLSYTAMGLVQRVVRDINWTWIVIIFLCALAWFHLVYRIALKSYDSPEFSICCAIFIVAFSYQLILQFFYALEWHGGLLHALGHNLYTMISYGRTEGITRLPRPGVTYAVLFLATLWIVDAAEARGWRWPVFSGVLGGAMAYVKADVWTSYMVAAGLFAAILSLRERRFVWKVWASVALSTLVSLPFLFSCYPPNPDILLREAAHYGRDFQFASLPYLAVFIAGLRSDRRPMTLFLSCMVGATFVMLNINIITGFLLLTNAWKYFGNIYVFFVLLSLLPRSWKSRSPGWLVLAKGLMLAALFQSVALAALHYPFAGIPKDYGDALAWLDRNTPRDSEVTTINPEINALIPVFTHDKVSLSYGCPDISSYPTLANLQRLVGILRLLGADQRRFYRECLEDYVNFADHRAIADTGFRRGEIEKNQLYSFLFTMTPVDAQRRIQDQALEHPAEIKSDYLWFGVMERDYAAKGFPRPGGPWREAYRNPSVALYRRSPDKGASE